ncbi:MAG TPA: integrase core domain-containing protein [Lacunisphaera sp.]|nr:integrase core domain-containing protein [Lacunisphaera sp.]
MISSIGVVVFHGIVPQSVTHHPGLSVTYHSGSSPFRALMRQTGLPEVIRTDLGSPFASVGLGRLSSLSVWWIEQGIEVEFTRPASPQDNGSHERMHKDLKAEATRPPSPNLAAQQRRFERWQHTYNHERPHEALHQRRPAEVYQPSTRRLNENDKPIIYPADFAVKLVSTSGMSPTRAKTIRWARPLPANRWACAVLPTARPNCTSPTFCSAICASMPREAASNPPPTSHPAADPIQKREGAQAPSLKPSP